MTRHDGFTLLEIIVALAILSVAVVAAIQGFAQGLRLLRLAGEHQHAALLADQKAREVVTPVEGREEGQTEDGAFTWERTTRVLETPELADQQGAENWRMYRINVHVRWSRTRDVEVSTLRTASVTQELAATPTTPGAQNPPPAPSSPSPAATSQTPAATPSRRSLR